MIVMLNEAMEILKNNAINVMRVFFTFEMQTQRITIL